MLYTRCTNTRTIRALIEIETLLIVSSNKFFITNPLSRYHVSPHYCWPTPLTPLRKFWLAFVHVFHPSLYATTRLWDRVQVAKRFRFIGCCSLFRNYMPDLYYVLRMDKLIHDFCLLTTSMSIFFLLFLDLIFRGIFTCTIDHKYIRPYWIFDIKYK